MRILSVLCLASLTPSLFAQSNTVAGLDGRLTVISNMTYYGRHGAAYPNGEIGMAMLNTMCNPGSVNIPWYAPMQPNHPMFGFIVARVHNDKIEQINEWSFCKHAFLSINVNGACGSCQNPGTGSLMGLNCADTYAAGNNASRTYLGPPQEIDPWLGEWPPVGSYFDIGDPSQAGYPAPADGVRSLNTSIFDSVDNRVTIDEIDLTTAGASYYYGLQLIHRGESLANRGDNNAHRGMSPSYNGSSWSFPNNSESQVYGSILARWPGATVESASNGSDDGRFYVASKVTAIGGGNYHYEYAVHNIDNSRAGASFRVPLAAGVAASNFTFGDIDTDGSNDWSVAQVGNEVVFTATASNALEWNTIYNFGFDADFPPGSGFCTLDAARPGAGNLSVTVTTEVPGGATLATFSTFGSGCPGSVPQPPASCPELNPNGGNLSQSTRDNEYTHRVNHTGTTQVLSFDCYTQSTGGTQTVAAYIYPASGGQPSATSIAQTTMVIGPTQNFYTATFASPVTVTGTFYIGFQTSAQNVYLCDLTNGTGGIAFYRDLVNGPANWTQSGLVDIPSWRVTCQNASSGFLAPALGISGLPALGTTYNLTLNDAVAVSPAVMVSGTSNTVNNGVPLPAPLPGAPGCQLLVSADVLELAVTSPSGSAASPITVPNVAALVGQSFYHQWAVWDPTVNSLNLVTSEGGQVTVGQ